MELRNTPQEKKIRDYTKQRKLAYGESTKCSRRAIRKRKRWVNKAYRKSVNNIVSCASVDDEQVDIWVAETQRHGWQKYPDSLILELFDSKWAGSSRTKAKKHAGTLRDEAVKRLKKSKSNTSFR